MKRILALFFAVTGILHGADKLVIITPHWEGVRIEIGRAFNEYYNRIYGRQVSIEWLDQGGTSDDLKYVESLFKKTPRGIGIDMFFGGGLDPFIRLKNEGLLQPYKVSDNLLKKIPPSCQGIPNYDRDYTWYGIVLSSFGILCNKKALGFLGAPIPSRWEDLRKKCYHGWVGISDPRHSGSMHMMFEIIMQANGWNEGWKTVFGLVGNSTSIPASASQAAKDTSIGQTAVSLAIDSYALAQIEQNGSNNMTFILPEGQTVINPDCAGILKGAPNRKTAEIFLEFLLSEECQKVWMLQKGKPGGPRESSLNRLSILPSLYRGNEDSVPVNPYSLKSALSFDFNLASSRWALLNDLIGVFAIDCADLVRKSYRRVLDGKCPERIFCELPIAEADQKTLIDRWKDQVFRNKQVNAFLKFSVRKFKTCLKQ